jgi:hypothetical protein
MLQGLKWLRYLHTNSFRRKKVPQDARNQFLLYALQRAPLRC